MPFLTVFTSVYNRAYIISRLYESLCRQTDKDFEWVVVDDGSTDNLYTQISTFKSEGKIAMRYFSQSNAGKHTAINRGINEAMGRYFIIVDSDDFLTDDAVEWIRHTAALIDNDKRFAGLSGIRIKPDGSKIGGGGNFGNIDANALDIRLKYGVVGDLAEVFRFRCSRARNSAPRPWCGTALPRNMFCATATKVFMCANILLTGLQRKLPVCAVTRPELL